MAEIDQQELLECAVRAAKQAGDHAHQAWGQANQVVDAGGRDIKLQLDQDCQRHAESVIEAAYPDHALLGEEGRTDKDSDYTWIIDPIDGTINYFHGLPHWCCSIAVAYGGDTVAAVVYQPVLDMQYTATADGPALANGCPLAVSRTRDLEQVMALIGLGKPSESFQNAVRKLDRTLTRIKQARIMGAAALDLCLVASGKVDAYLDAGISLWDYAAGALIASRAGGCFEITCRESETCHHVVCTNGLLHRELREIFADAS